jgi:hypothetical protein
MHEVNIPTIRKDARMTPGEAFLKELEVEFNLQTADPGARLVVRQLIQLVDEVALLEAAITDRGVVLDNGKVNPAVASARQHRVAIAQLVSKLGISRDSPGTRQGKVAARARWSQ